MLACRIGVSFLARDFWSGVSYGTCLVAGNLYLQVPRYQGRPFRVTFELKDYNEQLQKVSSKSKLQWLGSNFSFDLRLQ